MSAVQHHRGKLLDGAVQRQILHDQVGYLGALHETQKD
jgi:hypothetical protein